MVGSRGDHALAGVPRAPVIIGFCLLAFAGLASIVGTYTSVNADRLMTHSLEVRQAEAVLFSAVQDAEIGQRCYLLTRDPSYLPPYLASERRLPGLEATLHQLS